jgi:FkbM family methyltransferase
VNFQRLKKNISLNKFNNIHITPIGLGDRPGRFKLENIVEFNSGGKRIVAAGKTPAADHTEVEIDTLDNFLTGKIKLPKIDLIKIDVEGFELNVLRGAKGTLEKYSPVLFIELDDDNLRQQAWSAKELIRFLMDNNYEALNSESHELLTEETDFSHCHYDIICRRKLLT